MVSRDRHREGCSVEDIPGERRERDPLSGRGCELEVGRVWEKEEEEEEEEEEGRYGGKNESIRHTSRLGVYAGME
jgi:hypothetical protein